jgi:glycine cleavage system H protein
MMMSLDANTRFAPSHEWARKEGDEFVIGLSDHAQQSLGDIVFVELPQPGAVFAAQAPFGVVESVKAASDIFLPLGGRIIGVNEKLAAQPELINQDCYGEGWLIRIKPENPETAGDEWEKLLSPADYDDLVAAEV